MIDSKKLLLFLQASQKCPITIIYSQTARRLDKPYCRDVLKIDDIDSAIAALRLQGYTVKISPDNVLSLG